MYKILIIEDDLTMAQAIQKEMKMWGNDAQYVQDFKNVLETFAEFDPHLVLMDITLPFYNGYHWCSEIKMCIRDRSGTDRRSCCQSCRIWRRYEKMGD